MLTAWTALGQGLACSALTPPGGFEQDLASGTAVNPSQAKRLHGSATFASLNGNSQVLQEHLGTSRSASSPELLAVQGVSAVETATRGPDPTAGPAGRVEGVLWGVEVGPPSFPMSVLLDVPDPRHPVLEALAES